MTHNMKLHFSMKASFSVTFFYKKWRVPFRTPSFLGIFSKWGYSVNVPLSYKYRD